MLAFAGIEPGINDSGTESHGGRMVKHGSSQLRYVLLNACFTIIRFDLTLQLIMKRNVQKARNTG